jgi:hypothetical protein
MGKFKRITVEESKYHIKLQPGEIDMSVAFTLTPVEGQPGVEEVTYYGESVFDDMGNIRAPEWVYVLVNRSVPGVCKIGMTTTSVEQRTKEINSATGVITPWFPVFQFKCVNSRYLEKEVHKYLQEKGHRLNHRREGFEIDPTTASEVIRKLGEKYIAPKIIEE